MVEANKDSNCRKELLLLGLVEHREGVGVTRN